MDPNPNDRLKSEHNTELVPQHLQYSSSTSHSVNHFMWLSQVEVSLKSVAAIILAGSDSKPKQQDEPLKVMRTLGGSLVRSPVMPSDCCASQH